MSAAKVALSPPFYDFPNFRGHFLNHHSPYSDVSILIYLTMGGSTTPTRILDSESISSVKLRIKKCKGFFAKKVKLVHDGKELAKNNSTVRDYGVADGNILHLIVRFSDLQAITVRTVCGKKFEFHVQRKKNVGYVKQQIAEKSEGLFDDLKDQELFCDGEKIEDQRIIDDLCREKGEPVIHLLVRKPAKLSTVALEQDYMLSVVALPDSVDEVADLVKNGEFSDRTEIKKLPIAASNKEEYLLKPIIINPEIVLSPAIKQLIDATIKGLDKGNQPIRSSEGSGGAYLMQDSSGLKYVSVFKPVDEEPLAVNNPRNLPLSTNGEGLKKGTRVGEGALREVAAYILDHPRKGPRSIYNDEKGFSGVPPTLMVKCRHRAFHYRESCNIQLDDKFGSLQMFVENCGSCEDIGPCVFPLEEVHKICVLDIRLANTDRHNGNILMARENGEEGRIVLVPIDHGYCLPENFEDCTFEWLYWPQAQKPFSPETAAYIDSLDADQDIELLRFHGWNIPEDPARVLRISTMLLKKGARRGLSPFVIGSIMCRETVKAKSMIENMIEEARGNVLCGASEWDLLESLSVIMDHYLDGVS